MLLSGEVYILCIQYFFCVIIWRILVECFWFDAFAELKSSLGSKLFLLLPLLKAFFISVVLIVVKSVFISVFIIVVKNVFISFCINLVLLLGLRSYMGFSTQPWIKNARVNLRFWGVLRSFRDFAVVLRPFWDVLRSF